MGRRGPAPKPAAVKRLEGNPGKRQIKGAPQPQPQAPSCPSWLSAEARTEWQRLAPELERMGLLTALDQAAFACYCAAYAHWRDCQRVIEEEGPLYVTPAGRLRERPEVEMAKQAARAVREFAAEFGLTPSSRGRMNIGRDGGGEAECPRCTLPLDICGCW